MARLAKAMGALTIGIVTEPFRFEGQHRAREARKAIEAMRHAADTVVIVPNDRLLQTVAQDTSMLEAFHLADDVLRQVGFYRIIRCYFRHFTSSSLFQSWERVA